MKKPIERFILKIFRMINLLVPYWGKGRKVILCYHSIDTTKWEFSTSKTSFENQIKLLKQEFNFVTLEEIISSKSSKSEIAITFDDAYESFKKALPILKKLNIPVALFVTGKFDKTKASKLDSRKPLLKEAELLKLNYDNLTFGYHTANHDDLRSLTEEEIEFEINHSKKATELKLGKKLNYFAYPFGFYDKRVISLVKASNYKAAFTTNAGFLKTRNKFLIPRFCVGNNLTAKDLLTLLTPLGMLYLQGIFLLYRLKKNISK